METALKSSPGDEGGQDLQPIRPDLDEAADPKRVQIYFPDDFPRLSAERSSAAIDAFAAVIGVSPQAIEVHGIRPGSTIFYLGMPAAAVERLRSLLQANNGQLRLLKVEKIVLERESGEIETWVLQQGAYEWV